MEKNPRNYCVILAGGKGRRLWPSSREKAPKQFIDFFGCGRTQLQITYDRFSRFLAAENIFVCTTQDYQQLVREQLPGVAEERVLVEPVHRNTAASASWATRKILELREDATIIVSPSDQMVMNEDKFRQDVLHGLDFVAQNDLLLTLGVRPTRPEPGYGYIQLGETAGTADVYRVQSFTEKPDREFAQVFVESGEFLWNTGLFLARASYFRSRFIQIFPEMLRHLQELHSNVTISEEEQFMADNFTALPNISLDKGMLELNERAYVMRCEFGWADLGTWHSLYEYLQRGSDDNVVIDSEVMLDDCRNNIIKLSKGKLGVINGLDGYIVAERDNVLLICKKGDSSSLVRKYVNEVRIRYGEDFV